LTTVWLSVLDPSEDLSKPKHSVSTVKATQPKNMSMIAKSEVSKPPVTVNQQVDVFVKCTMRVTGMTCSSCVANIERHLNKCNGECGLSTCKIMCNASIYNIMLRIVCLGKDILLVFQHFDNLL